MVTADAQEESDLLAAASTDCETETQPMSNGNESPLPAPKTVKRSGKPKAPTRRDEQEPCLADTDSAVRLQSSSRDSTSAPDVHTNHADDATAEGSKRQEDPAAAAATRLTEARPSGIPPAILSVC